MRPFWGESFTTEERVEMFHRIISRKTSLEEKRGDYILDLEEVSEGLQRNIDDHPGKASEVIIIKEELQARIKLVEELDNPLQWPGVNILRRLARGARYPPNDSRFRAVRLDAENFCQEEREAIVTTWLSCFAFANDGRPPVLATEMERLYDLWQDYVSSGENEPPRRIWSVQEEVAAYGDGGVVGRKYSVIKFENFWPGYKDFSKNEKGDNPSESDTLSALQKAIDAYMPDPERSKAVQYYASDRHDSPPSINRFQRIVGPGGLLATDYYSKNDVEQTAFNDTIRSIAGMKGLYQLVSCEVMLRHATFVVTEVYDMLEEERIVAGLFEEPTLHEIELHVERLGGLIKGDLLHPIPLAEPRYTWWLRDPEDICQSIFYYHFDALCDRSYISETRVLKRLGERTPLEGCWHESCIYASDVQAERKIKPPQPLLPSPLSLAEFAERDRRRSYEPALCCRHHALFEEFLLSAKGLGTFATQLRCESYDSDESDSSYDESMDAMSEHHWLVDWKRDIEPFAACHVKQCTDRGIPGMIHVQPDPLHEYLLVCSECFVE